MNKFFFQSLSFNFWYGKYSIDITQITKSSLGSSITSENIEGPETNMFEDLWATSCVLGVSLSASLPGDLEGESTQRVILGDGTEARD